MSGAVLRVSGSRIVDSQDRPVVLRGYNVGGWMNMENFLTGYPGTESQHRRALLSALGQERYELFFEPVHEHVLRRGRRSLPGLARPQLGPDPVQLPALRGRRPAVRAQGRAASRCWTGPSRTAPGTACTRSWTCTRCRAAQNRHWHCDNATHNPAFWDVPALPGPGRAPVGGAGRPVPGQPGGGRLQHHERARPTPTGAPSSRSTTGWSPRSGRSIPTTSCSSTATGTAPSSARSPRPRSTQHRLHRARLRTARLRLRRSLSRRHPGRATWTGTRWSETFLRRTEFMRSTGTPIWIGEFGPVFTGDPERDEQRYQLLADQLDIYAAARRRVGDVGLQGRRAGRSGLGRAGLAVVRRVAR